jgi:hypothetical protein
MAKSKTPLADRTGTNETFLHRQVGGLGDELVKQQQEEDAAAKRDREIENVSLKDIADGAR